MQLSKLTPIEEVIEESGFLLYTIRLLGELKAYA
jgi:hypothetical protein